MATLTAIFATIAGLDITGIVAVLPPEVAKWGVVLPSAAAAVVHLLESLGKSLDGGSGSALLLVGALALTACPSCTITFEPSAGKFGLATDPVAVTRLVERITQKANEELEALPAVPIAEK